VPAPLAEVIDTATAKDPGHRFRSAAEFVDALDRLDPDSWATSHPRHHKGWQRRAFPLQSAMGRGGLVLAGLVIVAIAIGGVIFERSEASSTERRAASVPAPGPVARPTIVDTASRGFHSSAAFHNRRDGYLEISSFIPEGTFALCLPTPLIDQFAPGRSLCNEVYQGDGHRFTGRRIDPSTSRVYIRIDFRNHQVTASAHESCAVRHNPDPQRCDSLGAPVIENDVAYSNRFRPDWESCHDPHLESLIASDLAGCLTLAGQWFFPGESTPAVPYVNVQEHADGGGQSLRLIWYGPLAGATANAPRALSDGEIEFQANGDIHVRRDCWPDLEIDWVDHHGVHEVYRGNETNNLPPGYPIELNAARDKECVDSGHW
jgi:hypothetical protein